MNNLFDLLLQKPLPDPWLQGLLFVSFALHLLFVLFTLGTAILAFFYLLSGHWGTKLQSLRLAGRIAKAFMSHKSLAVVLGVAPLLLIQVAFTLPFFTGVTLFAQNCSACHTIGGINNIVDRVQGRTADGLYVIIGHPQEMVPFMPPFSGTDRERRTMADFLFHLADGTIKLGAPSRFSPLNGGPEHE